MSFRSGKILPLRADVDPALSGVDGLHELMQRPAFCGLAVLQDDRVVMEHYASDFGPERFHSIQSITKTFIHLATGRLVDEGVVDTSRAIGDYIPEAGPAYRDVSVQQALDMDVCNNFAEDYDAPYAPCPAPGAPVGYAREEIAMGWRLPPEGETEFGVRSFASGLVASPRDGLNRATLYKSANTDVLGWIIESASGKRLAEHVGAIVEAAGIESSLHVSLDCEYVPVLSGGGVMTARDLARYGLLIARGGIGIDGDAVGSSSFLADAMSGAGTHYDGKTGRQRYRNHLLSNGKWAGHPGYAGQFLMVNPEKRAAAAFFSVLETPYGDREGYFSEIISVLENVFDSMNP
jgi:CubicO group peptidase (beta-lactamase class C family)